jgi:hypothetical protein
MVYIYFLWPTGVFLGGGKPCCALIATPNENKANRRQKHGKKLNYKLRVILM